MHASAVRAFKVVEVDYRDLGRGIAADRPSCGIDVEGRVLGEVEGFQTRQRLPVGGDQEVERGGLRTAREGDRQRFIAGELAGLPRANRHRVVLGHVELRANQDLDATVSFCVGRVLLCGLGLAADSEAEREQASEELKTQQNGQPLKKG